MSNKGIKLSPKYGVNPTIPICFFCGEEKNEIALMGHIGDGRKREDIEAPKHMILDYEPCACCQEKFSHGVLIVEVNSYPNSDNQPPPYQERISHRSAYCSTSRSSEWQFQCRQQGSYERV